MTGTQTDQAFSLGSEGGDDGSFKRQDSVFRNWVTTDGSTGFAPEPGRYHLYVARACPWAHRTLIGRRLMGLEEAIRSPTSTRSATAAAGRSPAAIHRPGQRL